MSRPVVLITGCRGRVGSAVAERLRDDHTVVPVDPASDAAMADAIRQVEVRSGPEVASVLHLTPAFDAATDEVVDGTARLLRALRAVRPRQIVLASSVQVHGPCLPGARITEDSPVAPATAHAAALARAEELVRRERAGARLVVLRPGEVYDDGCHCPALADPIRRVRERRLIRHLLPAQPERGEAFVHRDDLVAAVERCVEAGDDLPNDVTLLVGEPCPIGPAELHRRVARLLHGEDGDARPVPRLLAWVRGRLRAGPDGRAEPGYALDINRARTLLGWEPCHSLRRELPALLGPLQADPERWYRENGLPLAAGRGKADPAAVAPAA